MNLINSSTFTVNSGTTNLSGGNGGTLTETSSTVNVRSGTFAGLVTLTGNGGLYNITGTLTNSGTLALSGSAISPTYKLQGGTINGGTLSTTSGAELTATQAGGTLNGVTVAGTLFTGQILNTFVDVKGGLTLAANGLVTMEGNGELIFVGSQSLTGTGTVDFADNLVLATSFNPSGLKGLYVPNSGDTLTIASGVTVHGITGFVGSTTGGFVTNNGSIAADGGGTFTVEGDTNYAAATLTGGTWQVSGTSTLILAGASISTNAASILLNGVVRPLLSEHQLQQRPGRVRDQRRRWRLHHRKRRQLHVGRYLHQLRHSHHWQRQHFRTRRDRQRLHANRRVDRSGFGHAGRQRRSDQHQWRRGIGSRDGQR